MSQLFNALLLIAACLFTGTVIWGCVDKDSDAHAFGQNVRNGIFVATGQ